MKTISNSRDFITFVTILAGILVLTNLVSRTLFFRWDWTENNIYTLSESSRSIIEQLDDRMIAKVYFSDNLPGQYANNRRYLQDMLEEFQAYSGGDFNFEIYRPEEGAELETEAQKYGVPPVQLQAIENDRMEIKNVWMGLALIYEDRQETIPVIQSSSGLEYELAAAIKRLINVNKKTVAIVSEQVAEPRNKNIEQILAQTYTTTTVELSQPVPPTVDLLMMNGISDSLDTASLYNLDQYLMSGRPLFLAQGRVDADLQQGRASEIKSNLLDALAHYGIQIVPGLVADKISSQIGVETQRGIFRMRNAVDYPYFPVVRSFSSEHLITSKLESMRLFFTSQILGVDGADENLTFVPLAYTSQNTAHVPGPTFNLNYENNPVTAQLNGAARSVAGVVSGPATSYFAADALPAGSDNHIASTGVVQILVVGDKLFFDDAAGGGIAENTTFVVNAADYLVGDADLISVRSREVTTRPLKEFSDGARRTIKWINILGPSTLVILLGLSRWRGNRRRRALLEAVYGS